MCFSSLRIENKIKVCYPTGLYSILFPKTGKETSHTVVKFMSVAKLEIFSFIDGEKADFKSFH